MKIRQFLPILAVAAGVLVLMGCDEISKVSSGDGNSVKGEGDVEKATPTVGPFSKLQVANAIKADVKQGDKVEVVISAQKSILPLIVAKVEGDTLKIYSKQAFTTSQDVHVSITAPKLDSIDISGASTANVQGFKSGAFEANAGGASTADIKVTATSLKSTVSGGSTLTFERLDGDTAKLEATGASQITVSGKVASLSANASSASGLHLGGLAADTGTVETGGASQADVVASKALTLTASGASTINYSGDAKVIQNSTGASTIAKR